MNMSKEYMLEHHATKGNTYRAMELLREGVGPSLEGLALLFHRVAYDDGSVVRAAEVETYIRKVRDIKRVSD